MTLDSGLTGPRRSPVQSPLQMPLRQLPCHLHVGYGTSPTHLQYVPWSGTWCHLTATTTLCRAPCQGPDVKPPWGVGGAASGHLLNGPNPELKGHHTADKLMTARAGRQTPALSQTLTLLFCSYTNAF